MKIRNVESSVFLQLRNVSQCGSCGFQQYKKNEKVPHFQIPHWKAIWLNIIVKQAPWSLVSRAWTYPCLAVVLLRDLNKSLLPLPELKPVGIEISFAKDCKPLHESWFRRSLLHCYSSCKNSAWSQNHCRSRNSTRSEFLACLNWLKRLDFSGNSLICTSREIGVHSVFFLRVFEESVNSKVLIKNYRHPGIFWFIGDCSAQMCLLWWIARFIKVALARQPQKHFCDGNFTYSSEEENDI